MWSACRKTVRIVAPARFAPLAICAARRALFPRFRGLPSNTSTVGVLWRGMDHLRFGCGQSSSTSPVVRVASAWTAVLRTTEVRFLRSSDPGTRSDWVVLNGYHGVDWDRKRVING